MIMKIQFNSGLIDHVDWTLTGGWRDLQECVAQHMNCRADNVDLIEEEDGTERLTVLGKPVATLTRDIGT